MPEVVVRISSPLPRRQALVEVEVDLAVTTVEWTTELPGGFGRCQVGLPQLSRRRPSPGYLPRPLGAIRGREHVEVTVGSRVVFEGQLIEVLRVDGEPRGFLAEGYGGVGLAERTFRAQDAATVTGGVLVQAALTLLPHITPDPHQWADPGGEYTLSEFDGQTVADIVQRVVRTGSGDGRIWDFAVWEGPRFVLQPRTPPATPDWLVSRAGVEETLSYERLATRVSVTYEDGETEAQQAAELEDYLGRPIELRVSGGQLSAGDAYRVRAAWAARFAGPLRAVRLRGADLVAPDGSPAPPWLVRAGQWVRVYDELYPITETRYEADSGRLEVRLGERIADWLDAWRSVEQSVRDLARGRNPWTGAPQ